MTRNDLRALCDNALAFAAKHKVRPGLQLLLLRDSTGRRVRLCKGVTGEVVATQNGERGPETLACFDPNDVLRAMDEGRL